MHVQHMNGWNIYPKLGHIESQTKKYCLVFVKFSVNVNYVVGGRADSSHFWVVLLGSVFPTFFIWCSFFSENSFFWYLEFLKL